jgi:hypothetical protein
MNGSNDGSENVNRYGLSQKIRFDFRKKFWQMGYTSGPNKSRRTSSSNIFHF